MLHTFTFFTLGCALLLMTACTRQEPDPAPQAPPAPVSPARPATPAPPLAKPELAELAPGQVRLNLKAADSSAGIRSAATPLMVPSKLKVLSGQMLRTHGVPKSLQWSLSLKDLSGLEPRFAELISSPEGLDNTNYPVLRFESSSITGTTSGPETHYISGKLYVRGVGYDFSFGLIPEGDTTWRIDFAFNPRRIGIHSKALDQELMRTGLKLSLLLAFTP